MNIKLLFEPRDLWIGLFWKVERGTIGAYTGTFSTNPALVRLDTPIFAPASRLTFYVCIVPTLAIRLTWTRMEFFR